jgi:radical SAM superfamily enzyme YgiQ (UPF0313 family)
MIVPHLPGFVSMFTFPTGYGYLAAALREAGHEVCGCNPNNDFTFPNPDEMVRLRVSRALSEYQPDLVCMGGLCTSYMFFRDTLRLLRDLAPHTPVVLGGGIVNHDAALVFQTLRPDFCVVGEAEDALVRLVETLEHRRPLADVPNIGYWQDGRACFTPVVHASRDINSLPFPDYSPFGADEMIERYSAAAPYFYRYTRVRPRLVTVVTARGCPFRCTFCIHGHGPHYRARTIDNCLEEIGLFYERTQFNVMLIVDELFAANKGRLKQFCERLIEARERRGWDFDWAFQTHARAALDGPTVKLAKKAGCFHFSYGFESASPSVLASMNKRSSPELVLNGIRAAAEAEVAFGGNLIFGDPAETLDTIRESLAFHDTHCRDAVIQFATVRPYPGSALFDRCLDTGLIADRLRYYETMDAMPLNMTSMSDEAWFGWCQTALASLWQYDWVKIAPATAIEPLTSLLPSAAHDSHMDHYWRVQGECPHCRHPLAFTEMVENFEQAAEETVWVLTGCARCNKRIKVTISADMARSVALGAWLDRLILPPDADDQPVTPDALAVEPLTADDRARFAAQWYQAEADPTRLAVVLRRARALKVPPPRRIDPRLLQQLEMEALATSISRSGIASLAIYGAGGNGRTLARALRRRGVGIELIADGNRALHGTTVEGVEVVPLARAVAGGTRAWAIGSSRSAGEILKIIRAQCHEQDPVVFSIVTRPLDWCRPSDWRDAEVLRDWRHLVRLRFLDALDGQRTWEALFLGVAFETVAFLGANRSVYRIGDAASLLSGVLE